MIEFAVSLQPINVNITLLFSADVRCRFAENDNGKLKTKDNGMVEIIAYQARWPQEFQEIADKLRAGLGDLALRIDHIGSTSVPNLAAKDIIDIQITVARLDDELNSAMESIGYKQPEGIFRDHCPPTMKYVETEWEKWFFHPPSGQRRTHTHVRVQDRANQRYPLLFRDYLRSHPASAGAYAELKRRLAANLKKPGFISRSQRPGC